MWQSLATDLLAGNGPLWAVATVGEVLSRQAALSFPARASAVAAAAAMGIEKR